MVPPYFVYEPNDLTAFATIEELTGYVEPEDVQAGVYTGVYDAEGRALSLAVETSTFTGLLGWRGVRRRVVVRSSAPFPTHAGELRAILESYASRYLKVPYSSERELADASLEGLAAVVASECIPRRRRR